MREPRAQPRTGGTRRRLRAVILAAMLIAGLTGFPEPGAGQDVEVDDASDREPVRMARATWDTGWFQAEISRTLIQSLGHPVDPPVTMENDAFYDGVAAGEVDLWVNGWFPLHDAVLDDLGVRDDVAIIGSQVDGGALQGYLVDIDSAESHDVTSLDALADPRVAERFDASGDGKADLVGCTPGWGCEAVIEHHLDELELRDTVNHVQGDYPPLMDEVLQRYEHGQPVLFYTWTPNWTVGELVPGDDVLWIEVPQTGSLGVEGANAGPIEGVEGCVAEPCAMGWGANDIQVVANPGFIEEHPPLGRLFDSVTIPLSDILEQNALMRAGEGSPEDIVLHASAWIADNQAEVERWLREADPDGAAGLDSDLGDPGRSPELHDLETIILSARTVEPFVIHEHGAYTGFSIELWGEIANRLGVDYEILEVNSLAKQIDDVRRGSADVAIGGLVLTAERARELDVSQPTFSSGLQVLVRAEQTTGLGSVLSRVSSGVLLSGILWFVAVFGLFLLVTGHVIWFIERRSNPDFPDAYPRGIAESIWWSVVAITPFGAGNNTPIRAIGRVFTVLWIIAGYFLLAYFTASVTTAMAVEEIRGDIAGPQDLPGHRIGTLADSPGADYLTRAGIGPILFDDLDDSYEGLQSGALDAIVYDAPVLRFHSARHGDFTVVGPVFEEFSYGFGLAPDGDLRREVDITLLELMDSGIYDGLYERWFGSPSR